VKDKIFMDDGVNLSDFAAWAYLEDIWHVEGDFSIPGKGFDASRKAYRKNEKELAPWKARLTKRKFGQVSEVVSHNAKLGREELERLRKETDSGAPEKP